MNPIFYIDDKEIGVEIEGKRYAACNEFASIVIDQLSPSLKDIQQTRSDLQSVVRENQHLTDKLHDANKKALAYCAIAGIVNSLDEGW